MTAGGGQAPFGPLGVMRSWLRLGDRRAGRERTATEPRQRGVAWAWIVLLIGVLYFFLPLVGTLEFSLRAKPFGLAYANVLKDPKFPETLSFSFVVGLLTIVVSLLLIVPTAYWVRLKVPRLRPVVEFVTLMPFVIPPVVLVFGLIRTYSSKPLILTATPTGTNLLLIAAYVVLSFPYMYRAVDTGLAAMDVRTLTEAAQNMGAGWGRILWQIIFPNLRVALLSGAFLTLAIVMGEYTIASFLSAKTFGPYLSQLGQDRAFEPAALSLISFGLTWMAMGALALLGRSSRQRVQVTGAR
jgi:putative spermidine/putrescine transport system permease protein